LEVGEVPDGFYAWVVHKGPGGAPTFLFRCIAIVSVSAIICVVAAFATDSLMMLLDAACDVLDLLSFTLNLVFAYLTRKGDNKFLDVIGGLVSTMLLIIVACFIMYRGISQWQCAEDVVFATGEDDAPCAFMQKRPEAIGVMIASSVLTILYSWQLTVANANGELKDCKPAVSMNLASALLHVTADLVQQFVVFTSALTMYVNDSIAVQVDAIASVGLSTIFIVLSLLVWSGGH